MRNQEGEGFLEILTFGILLTLNPAAGIKVFSKPCAVPKKVIASLGLLLFHTRATANAGSIWPAVPPPARTIEAILAILFFVALGKSLDPYGQHL